MNQASKQEQAVSPCINVCTLDDTNSLCRGCFRTIEEIAVWSHASNDERLRIIAAIAQRREEMSQ
ncbi:DUF1289 domain-containing protein [Propionivibrio sp.]|uniref:DUF1289 domain-containing protein n=1 Tax=Propionivibrio sp. TaxID=2212460 RepID=UPI003BF22BDA